MTIESHTAPGRSLPGDPLEDLLRRVRGRDTAALDALYRATCTRVHGLAVQILKDPSLAEEATLDTYMQVWREAERHDPEKGNVAAWLFTIARTRAIDLRRGRLRRCERETPLDAAFDLATLDASPERSASESSDARRVRHAVERLPAGQRRAVLAAYFGGLSHREVAEALGEPLGTVKTRIRAGLDALRRDLGGAQEERA